MEEGKEETGAVAAPVMQGLDQVPVRRAMSEPTKITACTGSTIIFTPLARSRTQGGDGACHHHDNKLHTASTTMPPPPQTEPSYLTEAPLPRADSINAGEVVMVECAYNGCAIQEDHAGIRCTQGHHFCEPCTKESLVGHYLSAINLQITNPTTYLACVVCKSTVVEDTLLRHLDPQQLEAYNTAAAVRTMSVDEVKQVCPHCGYFEVWTAWGPDMYFLFCPVEACQRVTCVACHEEVDVDKAVWEGMEDVCVKNACVLSKTLRHNDCHRLLHYKQHFEIALETGLKQACPTCGLVGVKDEACTHIYCEICVDTWCYFCGVARDSWDMDDNQEVYTHNNGWQNNPKRCPNYLRDFFAEVEDLEVDEAKAVEMFHRRRVIKKLRALRQEIGVEAFRQLYEAFPTIAGSGFTMEEVETAETRLTVQVLEGADRPGEN